MKKRLLSFILVVCVMMTIVLNTSMMASAAEPVTDAIVEARINELYNLLGGKYFTVSGNGCRSWVLNHGCSNCSVNQVLNAQWFKNTFGTIKPSQMFLNGGQSCMGFVEFAEWYIYRTSDSDTVLRESQTKHLDGFNYATISSYAHIGDYIRVGGHSFILISADSSGVEVLDCNWGGSYNCVVSKHRIPYTQYSGQTVWISKMYSKSAGIQTELSNPTACIITFDPNGGSVSQSSKTLAVGTLLTGIPTPTRSGYTFLGWAMDKIDPDGNGVSVTTIVADGVWTFDKDTTLYAFWKRNCTNHTYDAEVCTNCGSTLQYDNRFDASAAGTYQVSENTAYIRTGPYQVKDLVKTVSRGESLQVVGSVINSYNNTWLKTADGHYVHADKLTRVKEDNFPPLLDGLYTLTPKCASKMRLDVSGASTSDEANVQIYTSNNTAAQRWELSSIGNGYYRIISRASGKMLDVAGASTESGANVQQYTSNGTNAQQWMLKDAGDGYYYIVPRVNTALCLDVAGAGTADGTNVGIYTANGTDAQKWKLTSVDSYSSSDSNSSTNTPQYFNCNIGIFTVKGKTVNLYNNPGDSKRIDYFDLGQSVGSNYGVNMPDGTTWYQVSVSSKGKVITVWLKYESDKMTIRNLG